MKALQFETSVPLNSHLVPLTLNIILFAQHKTLRDSQKVIEAHTD